MRKCIMWVEKSLVGTIVLFDVILQFIQIFCFDIVAADFCGCCEPWTNHFRRQSLIQFSNFCVSVIIPVTFPYITVINENSPFSSETKTATYNLGFVHGVILFFRTFISTDSVQKGSLNNGAKGALFPFYEHKRVVR